MCRTALDQGITHFGLANNCAPAGRAEKAFGEVLPPDLTDVPDMVCGPAPMANGAGLHRDCPWSGHCPEDGGITAARIGASKSSQIIACAGAAQNLEFTTQELEQVYTLASDRGLNLWATSSESSLALR
ncbi:hypothetical protein GQR58_002084 [Nymphon striatum]|nr:hypothetical protein GQR58_002084 [Nymphon striatum]